MTFGVFRQITGRALTTANAVAARCMSTVPGSSGRAIREGGSSSQATAAELRQQFANNLSSQISNIGSHVVGRSVPVVAGGANKAYARLNRILSDNNIRRELSLRRRYEKPKYKRQRLRQESHARRFKEEVKQKVNLIMKMKNWGM